MGFIRSTNRQNTFSIQSEGFDRCSASIHKGSWLIVKPGAELPGGAYSAPLLPVEFGWLR
jgi:hypothetical protein